MTKDNYHMLLQRIENDNPSHPLLLTLKRGPSLLNQQRIIKLIQELSAAEEEEDNSEEIDTDDAEDYVLRGLYIKKSNLFVKRARFSNMLHECITDAERVGVVKNILAIQSEIETHFGRIRAYKKHGRLPEEDSEFPIPVDSGDLERKLGSVRANLSITRKKIKDLYQKSEKSLDDKQNLEKLDSKERHLSLYKEKLENEVANRKDIGVHEG